MYRLVGLGLACAAVVAVSAQTATLHFTAPKDWIVKPSSSAMRVAQYALPRAAGDTEDGELIVYFFGGQGGSVQANLDRWVGQMEQPDGRSSKAVATTEALTVGLSTKLTRLPQAFRQQVVVSKIWDLPIEAKKDRR